MKSEFRLTYLRVIIAAFVLGMVAKVTVPKTGQAMIDSKTSELIESLVDMRTSLAVYCSGHDNQLPPTSSFEEFVAAMTEEVDGRRPYIKRIPTNAFNRLDTVRFDGLPAGANLAGWRLDTRTGAFTADNGPGYAGL